MRFHPHDLLFLRLPDRFEAGTDCSDSSDSSDWPDWLDAGWLTQAPLVVRREAVAGSRVPVGARGLHRNQRCKGYVQPAAVARCVTPEMLAHATIAQPESLPPLAALAALAPGFDALDLAWGPTGGTGFHLATGLPVLRPDSDLDLLVRAPAPLADRTVVRLLALVEEAPCRVDIQVDTGRGGFALAEYARGGRVLVKTAHGPLLVSDPWRGPWRGPCRPPLAA